MNWCTLLFSYVGFNFEISAVAIKISTEGNNIGRERKKQNFDVFISVPQRIGTKMRTTVAFVIVTAGHRTRHTVRQSSLHYSWPTWFFGPSKSEPLFTINNNRLTTIMLIREAQEEKVETRRGTKGERRACYSDWAWIVYPPGFQQNAPLRQSRLFSLDLHSPSVLAVVSTR